MAAAAVTFFRARPRPRQVALPAVLAGRRCRVVAGGERALPARRRTRGRSSGALRPPTATASPRTSATPTPRAATRHARPLPRLRDVRVTRADAIALIWLALFAANARSALWLTASRSAVVKRGGASP